MNKLKMSNKKFKTILSAALCLLVAVTLVLNSLASQWSNLLDTYLGRGEATITASNTDGLDLNYYDITYTSDAESLDNAIAVSLQIAQEGQVLMKNNGALPVSSTTTVTPFGYRYISPIYGGTGSGSVDTNKDYVYTPEKALKEVFGETRVNTTVETALKNATPYKMTSDGIVETQVGAGGGWGADHSITEFNASIYDTDEIKASCAGTTAVVFIGRFGGETWDLQQTEFYDGTRHQLSLSESEKEMIEFAKTYCENVVIIINSSNQMELGELENDSDIDSILWIGGPGGVGFKAMAQILNGDVNPSGRTADTYYADFTLDPSLQNWGEYQYANSTDVSIYGQRDNNGYNPHYIEYEEGIYMGYRFYETAWYELEQKSAGSGDAWYSAWKNNANGLGTGVVYPFGYGLSYTSFTQEIISTSEADGVISVQVKVTNTGSVAGKDVVEIYVTSPYTDYDKANEIEKAYVTLIGFEKTSELAPGASETVTVSFDRDDMASYSYNHKNSDGTEGCYILEAGNYVLSARKNAHELYGDNCEATYTVSNTIYFEGENLRSSDKEAQSIMNEDGSITYVAANAETGYNAVNNKFQNMTDYMHEDQVTNLTRANWGSNVGEGSFPTKPVTTSTLVINEGPIQGITVSVTTRVMSDAVKAEATVSVGGGSYDYENDPELGNVEGSKIYAAQQPTQGAENGLSYVDMRGLSYYDEAWDLLLDQIDFEKDYEQIRQMLFNISYGVAALDSVGFTKTNDIDGPVGLNKTMGAGMDGVAGAGACAYPSEVVVACTYNKALTEEEGRAMGEESFQMSGGGSNATTGWYAPGLNTHRSPFNGRNFEYYSEDPTLAGNMGAAVVSGASSKGMVSYMKHFVLNDKELTQKLTYTWVNEQAFREIYLKAYELTIKNATQQLKYVEDGEVKTKTMRSIMGIMTAHNHVGATWAGSDYQTNTALVRGEWGFTGVMVTDNATGYATSFDRMVRSGNDTWMGANMGNAGAYDTESATSRTAMRNAIHNILYNYANSSATQGMASGSEIVYSTSPWKIALYAVDAVVAAIIAGGIYWMVAREKAAKANPELYLGTPEGDAIAALNPVDPEVAKKQKMTEYIIIAVIVAVLIYAVIAGVNFYNGLFVG